MTINVITTNRACVLLRSLTIEIRDMPVPSVGDDDVLVKIEATGICGSDVSPRPPNYFDFADALVGSCTRTPTVGSATTLSRSRRC